MSNAIEQWDEIVYRQWPYMILKSVRPFSTGFNVYKANADGTEWIKLNPRLSWFGSEAAAKKFISDAAQGTSP